MSTLPLPDETLLRIVGAVADEEQIEAYAVGGCVRDALLGRLTKDLDFVTVGPETGLQLAKAVAFKVKASAVNVYETFGTAAVKVPKTGVVLEFVTARKESYQRDSRKPEVEPGTLEDDQARRDFTINALAIAINEGRFGNLLDPFGGVIDLMGQKLRTPLNPRETFDDDPLRMMRAARFAAQLNFVIDADARRAMTEKAKRISIVSPERVIDELNLIMAAPKPSVGLLILYETKVLHEILPELTALVGVETVEGQSHKDNFFHTLEVIDHAAEASADWEIERKLALRWAALMHDIGKAETKRFVKGTGWTFHGHEDRSARRVPEVFRRLKLPLDERMKHVQKLVQLHHRPVALVDEEVTDSAVRRLLFDAGDAIDDLMTLVRADITSKNPQRVQRYLASFDRVEKKFAEVEERDRLRNFQPPIDGLEIMQLLGVEEGVAVGIVKEWIREAILEGDLPNEHAPALEFLHAYKEEALRRAELFETVVQKLTSKDRHTMGTIKEAVFWDELPINRDLALKHLDGVREEALNMQSS